ncbi:MAG TPA: DUF4184 family protein [Methylomirabilota bacterium]|jgi:hypothetical protein|nr:DUF4184 family protein [Methylomirabilota bacterium]
MPFTLSHPAAVLPIWRVGRPHLRLAALIIGSMTPDYEYFLRLYTVGRFSHSPLGLLTVCLPAGWLCLWLFDRYGRRGVQALLPAAWTLPPPPFGPYPILATSFALLLGATSHVLWDGFTHPASWGTRLWPGLFTTMHVGPFTMPLFRLLQHASTVVGLAVLGVAALLWAREQPRVPAGELAWRALVVLVVLGAAGLLNGARFWGQGLGRVLVGGGVAVTFTVVAGLTVLGVLTPRPR